VHGSNAMASLFLNSILKLGYKVEIVQKIFSKHSEEVGRFSFIKLARIPLIALMIIQEVRKRKPDLCFYFISKEVSGFLVDAIFIYILRLLKVPYILYCHGYGLREIGDNNFLLRIIASKTIGGASGALVLSDLLKYDLIPYVATDKIFALPNAIENDTTITSHIKHTDTDRIQVLFLSNLKQSKGALEFLKMAKLVAAQEPEVRFVLAGPKRIESFYSELINFIEQEGLKNVIELSGGLYGEAKNSIFRESDIFVLPTQNDAFPLVILEAMRSGLPIISSPIGAIPEMVVDGKNGFIVNATDIPKLTERTLQLVKDGQLRNRMGIESRKRYEENFDVESYQNNLAKAIKFFNHILYESKNLEK
jgi:glycosyltransferase involved in cell wall biosynthesis